MLNSEILIEEIESSRQQMNELSKHLPLISEEVIQLSQYIDQLLNEFHRITEKKQLL